MVKLLLRAAKLGHPQSEPLALWGKEGQRSECALTFEKSRGKQYIACPDVVGHNARTAEHLAVFGCARFGGNKLPLVEHLTEKNWGLCLPH